MAFLRIITRILPISACLLFAHCYVYAASDASLVFAPSTGSYMVGSTFDVTVALDTHGNEINTIELYMTYSPDTLQVIKPAGDKSLIQSWFSPPSFSNQNGTLKLVGGIASGGANTSNGLITTITFRATAPGNAQLAILKNSRVLAHDGMGTDILGSRGSAVFAIRIHPPEGPEVSSPTHPDPSRWYQNNAPLFTWTPVESAEGYSYALSENSDEVPAAAVNTKELSKSFSDIKDGIQYFHLRVEKDGAWSGASHLPVRIDASGPLPFTPTVDYAPQLGAPPIVYFETKDQYSGMDHYAVKVIRTDEQLGTEEEVTPFFVETESPYKVPVSFPGKYSVIVRAFDKAGNTRDATVTITTPTVALLSDQGIKFKNIFIPFQFMYMFFGLLAAVLFLWGLYILRNLRLVRVRVRKDISALSEDMQKEYLRMGEHIAHEISRSVRIPVEDKDVRNDIPPEPPLPQ
jgi:hypothetical protein